MNIYISENIKRLRQEKRLTQEALANIIGISFQAVSKWECGDAYPDITLLPVIANYFEVTIDELLGNDKIKIEESKTRREEAFLLHQKSLIENVWNIMAMIDCYHQWYSDFINPADKLALLKISADLTDVIYAGEDNKTLARAKGLIYEDMAKLYFSIGDKENGYIYLEAVVDTWTDYWFTFDESEYEVSYKSPLFNRLKWNKPHDVRNTGTNIYLNNINTSKEYDCVRDEERFMQCVRRLEGLIK